MLYVDFTHKVKEDIRNYFQDRDYLVIAIAKEEPVRVYAVDATNTVRTAQRVHALKDYKAQLLGKALISALLLTSLIKHATDQKVLFKLDLGEGSVVAEADGKGRARGFVDGEVKSPWHGSLTVMKELRLGVPYTSIVPLVSDSVEENLRYYFQQSEQIPTWLDMAVLLDKDGSIKRAGGYVVQALGGAPEEVKELISERFTKHPPMELLLEEGKKPEDIALYLLEGMEPRLIGLKEVEYYCPCSEEIAKSSLLLLSQEELSDMLEEGPAEVVCKFCGRIYRFTKEQVIQ